MRDECARRHHVPLLPKQAQATPRVDDRDPGRGMAMALISGHTGPVGRDRERCHRRAHERTRPISVHNRNADCLRCVEACTSGRAGITRAGEGELLVEPKPCYIGSVGTCIRRALHSELRNPTDAELTAQLKHSIVATGHPVIVCEQALGRRPTSRPTMRRPRCAMPMPGARMDDRRSWGWRRTAPSTRDAGLRFDADDAHMLRAARSCADVVGARAAWRAFRILHAHRPGGMRARARVGARRVARPN